MKTYRTLPRLAAFLLVCTAMAASPGREPRQASTATPVPPAAAMHLNPQSAEVISVAVGAASPRPGGQGPGPNDPAPSCPLSLADQEKSIKAFAKLIPVFRHPRCQNCHGGLNPLSGKHGGVELTQEDARNDVCSECHTNPNWNPPSSPEFHWFGKSDEWLCRRLHDDMSGEHFLDHLHSDDLITLGFEGKRALNEGAQVIYAEENGRPFEAEPPPLGHRQFWERGIDWLKAMGGEFAGSPECGCVHSKIELKMTSAWTGTGDGGRVSDSVSATVTLTADSTGLVFTGTAPIEHGQYTITTPPGCRVDMKPSGGELTVTEARFDIGADERMTIALAIAPTKTGGTMAFICPKLPMAIPEMPILPWAGEWQHLHRSDLIGDAYHFDEFDAASGGALAGERKLVGSKEVSRTAALEGMTVVSKTTFEFWWVGLEAPK